MIRIAITALGALFAAACNPSQPALAPGDAAPHFTLMGSDGKVHDSAGYAGKWLVIAWFPKAFTGG